MSALTPAKRLIVAADFKPAESGEKNWVKTQVLKLADSLHGTGVYLKVNSALRSVGFDLIDEIHCRGLSVFADLKLFDIGETLATDGALIKKTRPELLTVSCLAGVAAMQALKAELPYTEILGVTVLTSQNDEDTHEIFRCPVDVAVLRLVQLGIRAQIGGFISSAAEASKLRANLYGTEMTINTPAIRPLWANVKGDDQNKKRVMTPGDAIKAGADRIVVGRPIVQAENPFEAVMRTIEEIASAM